MTISFQDFQQLPEKEATAGLLRCCGCQEWARKVLEKRPYSSREAFLNEIESIWFSLDESCWREAFDHHPRIGDIENLKKKFPRSHDLSSQEQSGLDGAGDEALQKLAQGNKDYEEKFGHLFLVCASGKTAAEMLEILENRMQNSPEKEMKVAIGEQNKITRLRVEKWIEHE